MNMQLHDKTYYCPECGAEYNSQEGIIVVEYGEFSGVYCMQCFIKWISINIPRLRVKERKQNGR